jgi:hypothetical protein
MNSKVKVHIKKLGLKKHPEGGYFREIYRSSERILPEHLPKRYKKSRNFSTSIYFLLEGKQFSAFHLLQSDELWHFYSGSTVLLYIINQSGEITTKKVGRSGNCEPQIIIEKRNWFAAEIEDKKSFSLFGCTVSPGFEFADFELGKRQELNIQFPQQKSLFTRLTRL